MYRYTQYLDHDDLTVLSLQITVRLGVSLSQHGLSLGLSLVIIFTDMILDYNMGCIATFCLLFSHGSKLGPLMNIKIQIAKWIFNPQDMVSQVFIHIHVPQYTQKSNRIPKMSVAHKMNRSITKSRFEGTDIQEITPNK